MVAEVGFEPTSPFGSLGYEPSEITILLYPASALKRNRTADAHLFRVPLYLLSYQGMYEKCSIFSFRL